MHRHFEEIDSTNEEALRWGRDDAPHGAVVTAHSQSAGRGRRGRSWSSPGGKGLYLSVILRGTAKEFAREELTLAAVPRLNFVACLATARAVHELTGHACQTKWPNDVLLNGRKIAGVLSEAELCGGELDFAVVGVGLNVNQSEDELPERPLYPASSLQIETRHAWPIEAVTQGWLHDWWVYYHQLRDGAWTEIRDEFWRRCAQNNQRVTVQNENKALSGLALGLAQDGALLLETQSGIERILAGDLVQGSA
ncbi:MAG TPA: biotin--[acetyl-CoA-carboxylase] ligase [Abditibacteriaceae bacterium]|jgi:BirA family biotin operon repressor/biotin-[acetyl-CoA-carboxylase] ligase